MNTCLVACTSRFEFYAKLVTGRWLHGNLGRLHLRAGLSHCFQEQPGMKRESCMSPIRQCLGSYKGQSLFAQAYNRFWEAASKMHELRGELFNCASTLCAYCCEPKMLGCFIYVFLVFFEIRHRNNQDSGSSDQKAHESMQLPKGMWMSFSTCSCV